MIPNDPYRSDDPEVLDVDDPNEVNELTEDAIAVLERDFGRGETKRRMLVSRGVSLNKLHKLSK